MNDIPDECEFECNANGVPDDCDIDPTDPDGNGQASLDCNANGIPDECDAAKTTSSEIIDATGDGAGRRQRLLRRSGVRGWRTGRAQPRTAPP